MPSINESVFRSISFLGQPVGKAIKELNMTCYLTRLGEVFLSDSCTEEALLAVPLVEVKSHEPTIEVKIVETTEIEETKNTGDSNDVVVTPPVMSAGTSVNRTVPPGRRSAHDQAPFDNLASTIAAQQNVEKEASIGKSSKRIGITGHTPDSLNLWRQGNVPQASEEADANYALPEVNVTLFDFKFNQGPVP